MSSEASGGSEAFWGRSRGGPGQFDSRICGSKIAEYGLTYAFNIHFYSSNPIKRRFPDHRTFRTKEIFRFLQRITFENSQPTRVPNPEKRVVNFSPRKNRKTSRCGTNVKIRRGPLLIRWPNSGLSVSYYIYLRILKFFSYFSIYIGLSRLLSA